MLKKHKQLDATHTIIKNNNIIHTTSKFALVTMVYSAGLINKLDEVNCI